MEKQGYIRMTASIPNDFAIDFLRGLVPSAEIEICEWVEANIYLSDRAAPNPGFMKLWKYQRGILEAIADERITFISVIKAARVGFTKAELSALCHFAANDPCAVLLLLPTEDDCNRFSRDEVQPMFQESPALAPLLSSRQGPGDRDSLTAKYFLSGASLKIIASRSPRNLRSHDAKVLLMDEVDAYEISSEGSPVDLAIKRTLAHDDRKIVMGSTPTIEGVSEIQRAYDRSDKRTFEVPCPHCTAPFELLWNHIAFDETAPEDAYAICPNCGCIIEEKYKAEMVEAGEWRATAPNVKDHAGFRLNALVSLFSNASWGNLAKEFLAAKAGGPAMMRTFENITLGKCSSLSIDNIDALGLANYAENFGVNNLPAEVLMVTCGVDVQADRVEAVLIGWSINNQLWILGHFVFLGQTSEDSVWAALDRFLQTKWSHPAGYQLGIEATAIDSGFRAQKVYDFTQPRHYRSVFAIKGQNSVAGERAPIWKAAFSTGGQKSRSIKAYLVAVDQVKLMVLEHLGALPFIDRSGEGTIEDTGVRNPLAFRFSRTLSAEFYAQLANERRYIRYIHNVAKIEFHPIREGAKTEAIDATCYALAVRHACLHVNMRERSARHAPSPTDHIAPKRTMADFARLGSQARAVR